MDYVCIHVSRERRRRQARGGFLANINLSVYQLKKEDICLTRHLLAYWPARTDSEPDLRSTCTYRSFVSRKSAIPAEWKFKFSIQTNQTTWTAQVPSMFFGLPERIRTADLQSRSLTRYPAVPRADLLYFIIFFPKSKAQNHKNKINFNF